MKKHLSLLRETFLKAGLDGMLLTGGVSIRYFTGFTSDECMVLVTKDHCCLTTDFRYTIQAEAQVDSSVKVMEHNRQDQQLACVKDQLLEHGCKVIGIEDGAMTVATYDAFKTLPVHLIPFSKQVNQLRIIKTPDEVEKLKKAQSIADAAFGALISEIKPGLTEREVAARLTYLSAALGSDAPAFDPIVGSGPNGAMCHAIPGDRKLQDGDFVVLDFGCTYEGYRSDMTRTFAIGHANQEMKQVYAVVLEAQNRALNMLRAGISGRTLDDAARSYIVEKGYGDCFGHGLGHGFGLEIHEQPRAALVSHDIFAPGMTITVEPGVYLPGKFGVRIEDCCVVTENGYLNLVSTAKDLLIV